MQWHSGIACLQLFPQRPNHHVENYTDLSLGICRKPFTEKYKDKSNNTRDFINADSCSGNNIPKYRLRIKRRKLQFSSHNYSRIIVRQTKKKVLFTKPRPYCKTKSYLLQRWLKLSMTSIAIKILNRQKFKAIPACWTN